MTSTATAPALEQAVADSGDELNHYYCCDPDIAYCGADISDANETDFPEDDPSVCVVCVDLDNSPCPRGCTDGSAA